MNATTTSTTSHWFIIYTDMKSRRIKNTSHTDRKLVNKPSHRHECGYFFLQLNFCITHNAKKNNTVLKIFTKRATQNEAYDYFIPNVWSFVSARAYMVWQIILSAIVKNFFFCLGKWINYSRTMTNGVTFDPHLPAADGRQYRPELAHASAVCIDMPHLASHV